MKNDDLLKQFEVEELEQRLEFAGWGPPSNQEYSPATTYSFDDPPTYRW